MIMLPKSIRNKIEEVFGDKIVASGICAAVAEDIFQKTKNVVSETSVQRWFGLVADHDRRQLKSTLSIIANYLGYESWELLQGDLDADVEISQFSEMESLASTDINEGTQVQITYAPGRMLHMTYLGDDRYLINESVKSKLQQGDKVRISHFAVGFELLVTDVERNGKNLGAYQAAKIGGLTSVVKIMS